MPQCKLLRQLQDDKYELIQNDTDLQSIIDYCGIASEYASDITGAIVWIVDGDYAEVWFTESAAYYELNAIYHTADYWKG